MCALWHGNPSLRARGGFLRRKFAAVRTRNGRLTVGIVAALLSLVCAWLLPAESQDGSVVATYTASGQCAAVEAAGCPSARSVVQDTVDSIVDVSLTLSLPSRAGSESIPNGTVLWSVAGDRSIHVAKQTPEVFRLEIPTRPTDSGAIGIGLTPQDLPSELQVTITRSRSFEVTVDGKIVYAHRYNEPVVYLGEPTSEGSPATKNARGILLLSPSLAVNAWDQPLSTFTSPDALSWSLVFLLAAVAAVLLLPLAWGTGRSRTLANAQATSALQRISLGVIGLWMVAICIWFWHSHSDPGHVVDVLNSATDSPFTQPGPRFSDWFQVSLFSKYTDPYAFDATNYPPTSIVFMKLFGFLSARGSFALVFGASAGMLLACWWHVVGRFNGARSWLMCIPAVISFPILFAYDRGNMDIAAVALIFAAIIFNENDKGKVAGLLLAIAVVIKLWPVIFVVAFLLKRSTRAAGVVASVGWLLSVVLSLLVIQSANGVSSMLVSFGTPDTAKLFAHSYAIRSVAASAYLIFASNDPTVASGFADLPIFLALRALTMILLLFGLFRLSLTSQRMLMAAAIALLIPGLSFEYRAVVLVIVLAFEIREASTHSGRPLVSVLNPLRQLCWIAVLGPTAFWYFQLPPSSDAVPVSTATFIAPLALVGLCLPVVVQAFRRTTAPTIILPAPQQSDPAQSETV